jgi:hypothetical protein
MYHFWKLNSTNISGHPALKGPDVKAQGAALGSNPNKNAKL